MTPGAAWLLLQNHTLDVLDLGRRGGLRACVASLSREHTSYVNLLKRYKKRSFLVDPASSICLSLRLSHACLSINIFVL